MILIPWTDKIEDAWWKSDLDGDCRLSTVEKFGGILDDSETIIFEKDEDATAFKLRFGV